MIVAGVKPWNGARVRRACGQRFSVVKRIGDVVVDVYGQADPHAKEVGAAGAKLRWRRAGYAQMGT